MPKNKGKGGKNRRKGKGEADEPKELLFKEDGQEYGQVSKLLGSGHFEIECFDSSANGTVKRNGHVRGKMRKRVYIANGDVVLVSLRDYQEDKCDIIHKYTPDEARNLRSYKEIPSNTKIDDISTENTGADITFSNTIDDSLSDSDESDLEDSLEKKTSNKTSPKKDPLTNQLVPKKIVPPQTRKVDLPKSDGEESDNSRDSLDVDAI